MEQDHRAWREERLRKALANTKLKCCIPGCEEDCIGSHLISESVLRSSVAKNGFIFELNAVCPRKWRAYEFSRRGIRSQNGDFAKFKGFCREHDHTLFQKIDVFTHHDDIDSEYVMLAFIRTMAHEQHKLIRNINWHVECIKRFSYTDAELEERRKLIVLWRLQVQNLKFWIDNLYQNMIACGGFIKIDFRKFLVSKCGLVASCVFANSFERSTVVYGPSGMKILGSQSGMASRLIVVTPTKSATSIILAWDYNNNPDPFQLRHSGPAVHSIEEYVTDMLVNYTESWGISQDAYENLSEENRNMILDHIHYLTDPAMKGQGVNFNLIDLMRLKTCP